MVLYLGEFGNTVLSRSVGLEELVWLRQLETHVGLTFVVNLLVSMILTHTAVWTHEVRPAEFSEVYRPVWGPGCGLSPFASESKSLIVVSGVRSS